MLENGEPPIKQPKRSPRRDNDMGKYMDEEGPHSASGSTSDMDELDGTQCSICLQEYNDRTVIPECAHEFCFECILIWAGILQASKQA